MTAAAPELDPRFEKLELREQNLKQAPAWPAQHVTA